MIDALGLTEVFIDLTVYHNLPQPLRLDCTLRLSCHLKVLVFFVLLPRRQANYNSIHVVDRLKKMLRNEPVQISRCTWASEDKFRRFSLISRSSRPSKKTRSLPPSSGSPIATFRLGCNYTPSSSTAVAAHTSLTKKILALVLDSIRSPMTASRKNLPHELDIANLFPPDFRCYIHGFSHKLGIISKFQLTIKAGSLNTTLSTKIINCYIYVTAGARPP